MGLDLEACMDPARAFGHPVAERPAQALTGRDPHPVKLGTSHLAVCDAAHGHLANMAARNASHTSGETVLPLKYVTGAPMGLGGQVLCELVRSIYKRGGLDLEKAATCVLPKAVSRLGVVE